MFGPDLLSIFNGDLGKFQHISDYEATAEMVTGLQAKGMTALAAKTLFVSEVPVVTRFWLFEAAIKNLLLWHLLDLPFGRIVQVSQSKPRPSNDLRLKRVRSYMEKDGAGKELRLSVLGLRVCMVATRFTGKKHLRTAAAVSTKKDKSNAEPMLLRLARGFLIVPH